MSRGLAGFGSTGTNAGNAGTSGLTSRDPGSSERSHESFTRWRERQYFGPRRWLETALRDSGWDKDTGIN